MKFKKGDIVIYNGHITELYLVTDVCINDYNYEIKPLTPNPAAFYPDAVAIDVMDKWCELHPYSETKVFKVLYSGEI